MGADTHSHLNVHHAYMHCTECLALQCFSLFKFRSGTHGLNEELGRHMGGQERVCVVWDEGESVSHTLWDCPA